MGNDDQFDGEIRLRSAPEGGSILRSVELIKYKIEDFGRVLLSLHGIDVSLDNGFKSLFRKQKNPLWPKTPEKWKEWGKAWRAINRRIKENQRYFRDGKLPSDFVKQKNLSAFLANEFGIFGYKQKPLSNRVIREICRAGEAGYLEKGNEGRLE
jgi:hypothetical protein